MKQKNNNFFFFCHQQLSGHFRVKSLLPVHKNFKFQFVTARLIEHPSQACENEVTSRQTQSF